MLKRRNSWASSCLPRRKLGAISERNQWEATNLKNVPLTPDIVKDFCWCFGSGGFAGPHSEEKAL